MTWYIGAQERISEHCEPIIEVKEKEGLKVALLEFEV